MRKAELKEIELHNQFREMARVPRGSVGSEWFSATAQIMELIEIPPVDQQIEGLAKADVVLRLFVKEDGAIVQRKKLPTAGTTPVGSSH